MALVELVLSPLPSHVRTSRMVVLAAARRAGLPEQALDEVRFAVGEACARAVGLHARHAPEAPVRITVVDDPLALAVAVTDAGPPAGPVGSATEDPATDMMAGGAEDSEDPLDPDVALALLSSLVDDVSVEPTAAGTTVTLRWPLPPGAAPGGTALSR